MLECDKQAVLIFLRNTAFGPIYEFTLTDPKTKKTFEHSHDLSNVTMKDFNLVADEKGEFSFLLPVTKKNIKFKFLTSQQENELSDIDSQYGGRIAPKITKTIRIFNSRNRR